MFRDINKDKAKGGRLGIIIGEGFEIGGSYYTGKYDPDNCVPPRPRRGRPDLGHEGLRGPRRVHEGPLEESRAARRTAKADGFFGLVALYLGKLQPVASFQRWDPGDRRRRASAHRAIEGGAEVLAVRSRWALGARYYLSPTFLIKAEYDINREKGPALKNNLVLVQAAVSF